MMEKKEDIFTSFKIVYLFGKIFHTVSFTIDGPPRNRKFIITNFDISLLFIYSLIYFIILYIFVSHETKNSNSVVVDITRYSVIVLHFSLVPTLIIFGIFHARDIFDILRKMQNICFYLEQKNIVMNYKEIEVKSLVVVILVLLYSIVAIICNLDAIPTTAVVAIYLSTCTIFLKSVELQLLLFLYIFNVLLKAFTLHINNNLACDSFFLKEILGVHFELFSLGKFINKIYNIFIVKIFLTWIITVFVTLHFGEMLGNLTFSFVYSTVVWIATNIMVIGATVYLYEACRTEV